MKEKGRISKYPLWNCSPFSVNCVANTIWKLQDNPRNRFLKMLCSRRCVDEKTAENTFQIFNENSGTSRKTYFKITFLVVDNPLITIWHQSSEIFWYPICILSDYIDTIKLHCYTVIIQVHSSTLSTQHPSALISI